eukprot:2917570-Pyramimonas_sp.AAC.1
MCIRDRLRACAGPRCVTPRGPPTSPSSQDSPRPTRAGRRGGQSAGALGLPDGGRVDGVGGPRRIADASAMRPDAGPDLPHADGGEAPPMRRRCIADASPMRRRCAGGAARSSVGPCGLATAGERHVGAAEAPSLPG